MPTTSTDSSLIKPFGLFRNLISVQKFAFVLLIAHCIKSAGAAPLESGLYICKKGNEPSICDQQVQSYSTSGVLTALKVEYVGWCGSMGPYSYYCSGSSCTDGAIQFEIQDARHYRWQNRPHGFVCDFEKSH